MVASERKPPIWELFVSQKDSYNLSNVFIASSDALPRIVLVIFEVALIIKHAKTTIKLSKAFRELFALVVFNELNPPLTLSWNV